MNSFQSAYTKFNSTETTLLAVYDHIIRAMSQEQVTSLCLLDLSAAFDTSDHSILLQRLKSWFGFNETVLSWIHSYLSSRSFSVDINGIKSPPSQLLYGVPQGSVLGPLLFILYTTLLNTIISPSSVNHKLYADDTQLFLFSSEVYSEKIQFLQDTISEISSWLQLILNSAARAITKTQKFHHITPHLKSLHWPKITQRIQYKILSLTYKSLQYNKPSISHLLTIQPTHSTRSSLSAS